MKSCKQNINEEKYELSIPDTMSFSWTLNI